jgi:hypothetical protein
VSVSPLALGSRLDLLTCSGTGSSSASAARVSSSSPCLASQPSHMWGRTLRDADFLPLSVSFLFSIIGGAGGLTKLNSEHDRVGILQQRRLLQARCDHRHDDRFRQLARHCLVQHRESRVLYRWPTLVLNANHYSIGRRTSPGSRLGTASSYFTLVSASSPQSHISFSVAERTQFGNAVNVMKSSDPWMRSWTPVRKVWPRRMAGSRVWRMPSARRVTPGVDIVIRFETTTFNGLDVIDAFDALCCCFSLYSCTVLAMLSYLDQMSLL